MTAIRLKLYSLQDLPKIMPPCTPLLPKMTPLILLCSPFPLPLVENPALLLGT